MTVPSHTSTARCRTPTRCRRPLAGSTSSARRSPRPGCVSARRANAARRGRTAAVRAGRDRAAARWCPTCCARARRRTPGGATERADWLDRLDELRGDGAGEPLARDLGVLQAALLAVLEQPRGRPRQRRPDRRGRRIWHACSASSRPTPPSARPRAARRLGARPARRRRPPHRPARARASARRTCATSCRCTSATASRSRCCSSTSRGSSGSTTPTAAPPATRRWSAWPARSSARCAASTRAVRMDEDEFCILLPNQTASRAQIAADRLVAADRERQRPGRAARCGSRSAWSSCPQHAATADELLELADGALYRAKAAGESAVGGPARFRCAPDELDRTSRPDHSFARRGESPASWSSSTRPCAAASTARNGRSAS